MNNNASESCKYRADQTAIIGEGDNGQVQIQGENRERRKTPDERMAGCTSVFVLKNFAIVRKLSGMSASC